MNPIRPIEAAVRNILGKRLGYMLVDADLVVIELSPNVPTLIGEPGRELLGLPLTDALVEFIGLEAQLVAMLQGDGDELRLERVNRAGGDPPALRYVDFQLVARDPAAPQNGLVLLIEDTTEFGRLEQALVQERNELRLTRRRLADANERLVRLDRLKTLFFSMAAHDLRSPLSVIRGFARLLQRARTRGDGVFSAEIADYIDTIAMQSSWLDTVIHNILDLGAIEKGELALQMRVVDIGRIIAEAAAVLHDMARLNELTLTTDIPAAPLLCRADPARITQVLHNLVSNAVKYSPSGGQVTLAAACNGADIDITVRDTGRGIAPDQLPHIFELYYRTPDAQTRPARGTGLGLFIVRSLVEAHGGAVSVVSAVGAGSTFTVRLPAPVD